MYAIAGMNGKTDEREKQAQSMVVFIYMGYVNTTSFESRMIMELRKVMTVLVGDTVMTLGGECSHRCILCTVIT
jgi:ribulose kinase